jgi:folate-binding protein YgfZ
MTEAVQIATKKSPLDEIHNRLGAIMTDHDGWSVPASYGDELFEYATVRESGAGLIDLSARGRLLVSGSEAVPFLNGLITNDMKTLEENRWMAAVFPNVQGRLLASVRVIRIADNRTGKNAVPTFLLDTEPATSQRVFRTIEKFTLAGDFYVTDLSTETALISLQGKAAAGKLSAVLGEPLADIEDGDVMQISWKEETITVLRAAHAGTTGFDLLVSASQAPSLWNALAAVGARPVGHDALGILRIEAGVPRYGKDMDDTTVVTETNLDEAVSYTKGCYIGQEIIARIKYRGHVAKKLRGLMFERHSGPASVTGGQATINSSGGKDIGRITSTALSPHLGCRIALGYVKYEYIASGTEVGVESLPVRVVDLPFIKHAAPDVS